MDKIPLSAIPLTYRDGTERNALGRNVGMLVLSNTEPVSQSMFIPDMQALVIGENTVDVYENNIDRLLPAFHIQAILSLPLRLRQETIDKLKDISLPHQTSKLLFTLTELEDTESASFYVDINCPIDSLETAVVTLRNFGFALADSSETQAEALSKLDSLQELRKPTNDEILLSKKAQEAARRALYGVTNTDLNTAVEMHEQVHVTQNRAFLENVTTLAELLRRGENFNRVYTEVGVREWDRYNNMLHELTILDEAIATFHTLTGQRVIGNNEEVVEEVCTFWLFNRLAEVCSGFSSNASVTISVEEKEDMGEISTIAPHTSTDEISIKLECDVEQGTCDFDAAIDFVFDRSMPKSQRPIEPHIASMILLINPNFLSDSDELPLLTFPRYMNGDSESLRTINRIKRLLDDPDAIQSLLTPKFYDKLVAKFAARREMVIELNEWFIQIATRDNKMDDESEH